MMKKLILMLLFLFMSLTSLAQDAFSEYQWSEMDLVLRYPSNWDSPISLTNAEGQLQVLIAQDFVETSDSRPPAIPFMTLTVLEHSETDLYPLLASALERIQIRPIGEFESQVLGQAALSTLGTSEDASFIGLGRISRLEDGRVLLIVGRAPLSRRDAFLGIFNGLVASLQFGAERASLAPQYGVLWYRQSSLADAENAFLDFQAMALSPDNTLYLLDATSGLFSFDSRTGRTLEQVRLQGLGTISAMSISTNGKVYLADVTCQCVHIFQANEEIETLTGFAPDAPLSIALAPDGTLYATDIQEETAIVKAFTGTESRIIPFEDSPFEQALLAFDRTGALVTLVDGFLYRLVLDPSGDFFTFAYALDTPSTITALAFNSANNLVITTEGSGVFVLDAAGLQINQLGTVVDVPSQAGEVYSPQALAAATDGTLYLAESDGSFGHVNALSLSVEAGRVGTTSLLSGYEVQGFLDVTPTQQLWLFDGKVGDIVSLTALADINSPDLDLVLRVLAPDGREIAFADNDELGALDYFFDAQLYNLALTRDGQYTVIVASNVGIGRYRLGFSQSQALTLSSASTEVTGNLQAVMPVERWLLQAEAGQRLTITMNAQNEDLDPVLRVYAPNGDLLAENDDADDESLGFDAQVLNLEMPLTGLYLIEATRFTGSGGYVLRVER